MANFLCDQCATPILDSPHGYVTGCTHYPLHRELPRNFVWVRETPNGMREEDYENADS